MRREHLPIEQLDLWMQLNNVKLNGVKLSRGFHGSGVVATRQLSADDPILMQIPSDLVLSLDNVWVYAKSDKHLLQVLEAVGDFSRTARGAILSFLLLQITHNATDGLIGASNPVCFYVKFLPENIPLPTFWSEDEKLLVKGTSLELALDTKLKSLDREFSHLRKATASIDWCQQHWWDPDSNQLTVDDWLYVDAAYRSRALDLPMTGHATVPCIDMANHASALETGALYETNESQDAILILADGKTLDAGSDVTITYGDEKGACEMIFSYGFIESSQKTSSDLFLDVKVPEDDPLALAKKQVGIAAPGIRLFESDGKAAWEGPFVWLLCLNEEDGLEFKIALKTDGTRELQMFFKDELITDGQILLAKLRQEDLWDVLQLRAATIVQARIEEQLLRLNDNKRCVTEAIESHAKELAISLRDLEESLMLEAYEAIAAEKDALLQSPTVLGFLAKASGSQVDEEADDFS